MPAPTSMHWACWRPNSSRTSPPRRAQVALAGRRDRLARIVSRCLQIDADDRYDSVREFASALRAQLERGGHPNPHRSRAGRLLLWGIVLAAELAVIAVLVTRSRFSLPVSRPVFQVEQGTQPRPDHPSVK